MEGQSDYGPIDVVAEVTRSGDVRRGSAVLIIHWVMESTGLVPIEEDLSYYRTVDDLVTYTSYSIPTEGARNGRVAQEQAQDTIHAGTDCGAFGFASTFRINSLRRLDEWNEGTCWANFNDGHQWHSSQCTDEINEFVFDGSSATSTLRDPGRFGMLGCSITQGDEVTIPMSRFLAICTMMAAGALAMSGSAPGRRLEPDDVVATVRGKAITYRMIRCHPQIEAEMAKRARDRRSIEEICLDAERMALRHRLETALIEAAAEICPIVPTNEELRQALPNVFDEEDIARSARRWRAKAAVVQRISRGEDAARVIDELLVPFGVTREAFLKEMPYWTLEGAEQVLSGDSASVVREQRKHDATVAAIRAALSRRHGGNDDERRRFWEDIVHVTNTTVREGFEPPPLETTAMKKILLLALSAGFALRAAAQAPTHISPAVKTSAREQIATAFPLIRAIEQTKEPAARQLAILQALSHLEVVPRAWPHDREAVVRAGLLEADVFARTNAMRNALEVLDRIEPLAARPAQRLQIAGRRGNALAKLGRVDEAAAVFSAALAMHAEAPRDRSPILNDAAAFYFFQRRNADLSRVLRESATLA